VVCPNTVAKLLKGLGYRLRATPRNSTGKRTPAATPSSFYIAAMRESFAQAGLPVVSVDSKHRELVGDFKNPVPLGRRAHLGERPTSLQAKASPALRGLRRRCQPRLCLGRHDPRHPELRSRQPGQVVGLPRRRPLPRATELLVLADSGGSNGARTRAWKYGLQHACATGTASRSPLPLPERRLEVEPH